MKKFLLRISLFGLFILGVFFCLKLLPPYYWGSPAFGGKVKYFESADLDPDILFVGPSTIMRHIMPSIFDDIIGDNHQSYSLSADGSFPRHSMYIFDQFVKNNKGNIKYVFFELESLDKIGDMRFQRTYTKYYTSFSWLLSGIKYIRNIKNIEEKERLKLMKRYATSYFENFFKVGMRTDYFDSFSSSTYSNHLAIAKKRSDGYMPLPPNKRNPKMLEGYLTKLLKKKKEAYKSSDTDTYNCVLLDIFVSYLKGYKEEDIHLIYILPPREANLDTDLEMLNLYRALPDGHKIDLGDPFKYPEFYRIENRYDRGHLSNEGAKMYTQKLAIAFKEILKSRHLVTTKE